jgi:hypothetical protein
MAEKIKSPTLISGIIESMNCRPRTRHALHSLKARDRGRYSTNLLYRMNKHPGADRCLGEVVERHAAYAPASAGKVCQNPSRRSRSSPSSRRTAGLAGPTQRSKNAWRFPTADRHRGFDVAHAPLMLTLVWRRAQLAAGISLILLMSLHDALRRCLLFTRLRDAEVRNDAITALSRLHSLVSGASFISEVYWRQTLKGFRVLHNFCCLTLRRQRG